MIQNFCVDVQYPASAIALGSLPDVTTYDELDDDRLRNYLEDGAVESRETTTIDDLDELVERELKMNMSDRNFKSRIEGLLVVYDSLLMTRASMGCRIHSKSRRIACLVGYQACDAT